jgi:small subunit ribosomal protein S11
MHELVRVELSQLVAHNLKQQVRPRKGHRIWQIQQKLHQPSVAPAAKTSRKKRSVPAGQMHIQATFNNTIVTFTDKKGNVLCAESAGACGFRGSKKGTAYAAQVAAEKAAELQNHLRTENTVDVFVKGVGLGRDAAIRALGSYDIQVDSY